MSILPVLVPVATTILTAIILFALRLLWGFIKRMYQEGKDEQIAFLKRIETQTLATNGRVTKIEQEMPLFRERLSHTEGQVEVLLREKGSAT